jgi:spermidine synthase
VYKRGMSQFTNMVEVLNPGEKGVAALSHYQVSDHEATLSSLRGQPTTSGAFCVLTVQGLTMMSDTHYERRTNCHVIDNAWGSVLIGGLGIGMILVPILRNPQVTKVTVLELHQDVIDLVLPQLVNLEGFEKLEVICCDCRTWQPPKGAKWDVIYWDIWPDICTDNLKEITMLKRRYARKLAPGGWQAAWVEGELRSRVNRDRKERRHMGSIWQR